jgi:hypothetical protein
MFFIHSLDVDVASQIIHSLAVRNILVEVSVDTEKGVENSWVKRFAMKMKRSINIQRNDLFDC